MIEGDRRHAIVGTKMARSVVYPLLKPGALLGTNAARNIHSEYELERWAVQIENRLGESRDEQNEHKRSKARAARLCPEGTLRSRAPAIRHRNGTRRSNSSCEAAGTRYRKEGRRWADSCCRAPYDR